jgi:hypothetical protein
MPKISFVMLALVSMFFVPVVSHAAPTFRYRTLVPASVDCAKVSSEIATLMSQQTGVQIVSSSCLAKSPGSTVENQVAIIIYSAQTEVEPTVVSVGYENDLDGRVRAGSFGGAYSTQASCEADLKNQSSILLAQAGAQAVNAHCELDQYFTDWIAKFETFQKLTKSLKALMMSYGEPSPDTEKLMAGFIKAQGIQAARVFGKYAFYYDSLDKSGQHPTFDVTSRLAGTFANPAECESQRPGFQSIVGTLAPNVSSLIFCSGGFSSFLEVLTSHQIQLKTQVTVDNYGSMAECTQDINRSIGNFKSPSGTAVGGICSYLGADSTLPYGITVYLN